MRDEYLPLRPLRPSAVLREYTLRRLWSRRGLSFPISASSGPLIATPSGDWKSPLPKAAASYRLCRNYTEEQVCNWAVPVTDAEPESPLCRSCRLTRVIPDLAHPDRRQAWYRLEIAKRRLVVTLLALRLPLVGRDDDPEHGLAFEFKADPADPSEPRVLTGHAQGVITVNLAEADDAERERRRTAMREPYRTLLGTHASRKRTLLLGAPDPGAAAARRVPPPVRRRSARLRHRAGHLPSAGGAGRLAGAIRQRVRQRPPVGGLGRNLGALPPHARRARNRAGVRHVAAAETIRRAVDARRSTGVFDAAAVRSAPRELVWR